MPVNAIIFDVFNALVVLRFRLLKLLQQMVEIRAIIPIQLLQRKRKKVKIMMSFVPICQELNLTMNASSPHTIKQSHISVLIRLNICPMRTLSVRMLEISVGIS